MNQFVHNNVVDRDWRQLHHSPVKVQRAIRAARTPSVPEVHDLYVFRRFDTYDVLPARDGVVQEGMGRPRVVLCNPLLARFDLNSLEQEAITVKTHGFNGRGSPWNVNQFQPVMPAKKVKTLAVDKFWPTKYVLLGGPTSGGKLLVYPDKLWLDQFNSSAGVYVLWKMSHQGRIALDGETVRRAASKPSLDG